MIKVELYNGNTKSDITQIIEKVIWSGNFKNCSRKLELSYLYNPIDKNIQSVNLKSGNMIRFYENNQELFRGYIITKEKSSSSTSIKVLCYDPGIYINKNEAFYNFKGVTANAIADKVCNDFGIIKGNIATSSTKFDRKFFGVSLYNIIMTAYSIEASNNRKKYMCKFNSRGELEIIEKGLVTLRVRFEEGNNIIESNYSESIEDMINKVVVLNEEGKEVTTVTDDAAIKEFGSFQKILKAEEGKDNKKLASSALVGITQSSTLTGFGDTTCITGYGVTIKDTITGLVGLFYIDEDVHLWENGVYSISLKLAFKNMMDEQYAGEVEEEENKNNTTISNSNSSKGASVVAEARKHLGKKYVWGATGPNTFDCSGLVVYCYSKLGVNLPRTTYDQINRGTSINKGNLTQGDLVFFKTDGTGKASHVGIYIGNGEMIHAPNSRSVIKVENINSGYYSNTYLGARRVV